MTALNILLVILIIASAVFLLYSVVRWCISLSGEDKHVRSQRAKMCIISLIVFAAVSGCGFVVNAAIVFSS